jgi:hypothetical protein
LSDWIPARDPVWTTGQFWLGRRTGVECPRAAVGEGAGVGLFLEHGHQAWDLVEAMRLGMAAGSR